MDQRGHFYARMVSHSNVTLKSALGAAAKAKADASTRPHSA